MKPPFGVVDADGHINEPEARLLECMEAPYRHQLHASLPDQHGTVYPTNALAPKLTAGFDPTPNGGFMGDSSAATARSLPH